MAEKKGTKGGKAKRSRKGYLMVELKDPFRERLDWLLADEERKTGTRPEQAPFVRILIWQEYERRQPKV